MLPIAKNGFLKLRKRLNILIKNQGKRSEKTVPFSSSESTVKMIL